MSRARVHQLLPAAHWGDATGDASLHLARGLRAAGYDAGVYALSIDAPLAARVQPFDTLPEPRPGDLTILHFALPSPLSGALEGMDGGRAIVYHNLTPPRLLATHAPAVARLTAAGLEQLRLLGRSGKVDLAIGVSEFNSRDLRPLGFSNIATLPLPMDLQRYDSAPDPILTGQLAAAPRLFLTVGRIAPNKRLEDFLRAAAYYLRYIDPNAWFVAVGGDRGLEGYHDALMQLHRDLDLDERVRFVGRVSHAELVAWYRRADAYLCASEHEGFCAPLLEAMHFGVPIVARAAAAVPETLGDAGILYTDPDPAGMAELLHLAATDEALRQHLCGRAAALLPAFAPEQVIRRWVETLAGLLESLR